MCTPKHAQRTADMHHSFSTLKFFLLLLLPALGFLSACQTPQQAAYKVYKTESMEVIEAAFEHVLLAGKNLPEFETATYTGEVFISSIVPETFPFDPAAHDKKDRKATLYRFQLPFMVDDYILTRATPEELKARAEQEGDFVYLMLGNIDIGSNRAEVGMVTAWQTANSEGIMASRDGSANYNGLGGYRMAFVRQNGKWVFHKYLKTWGDVDENLMKAKPQVADRGPAQP